MRGDFRSEANREAMRAVCGHWRLSAHLFWLALLTTLLGLSSCLLPFCLIGVVQYDPGRTGPPTCVRWSIGVGLGAFIVGLGVTLVLWQRPAGYVRAEKLITLADRLGLCFRWPRQEGDFVAACKGLPSWPYTSRSAPVPCSLGGLMVMDAQGSRLALAEPTGFSDPLADLQAFVALRCTLHHRLVYAVWLAPEGRAIDVAAVEAVAQQAEAHRELIGRVVALRVEDNLGNEKISAALLAALTALAVSPR
jgi:hypothetical protein